ncbi:hypothetical protein C7H79_14285 [Nitrosomonas supralitoralis]|uniref:Uncharacterized protein n=1 Tax=Nitrosomonas supralitoralis TaxID=2116706 RepID=A0A2P7NS28_9PROT|nr:hypothetical protein C7H79_14285 [Nitrosomonas supralitoralis]
MGILNDQEFKLTCPICSAKFAEKFGTLKNESCRCSVCNFKLSTNEKLKYELEMYEKAFLNELESFPKPTL